MGQSNGHIYSWGSWGQLRAAVGRYTKINIYFYFWDPLLKQLRELRTAEGSCGKKFLISYFSSFFWDPSTNSWGSWGQLRAAVGWYSKFDIFWYFFSETPSTNSWGSWGQLRAAVGRYTKIYVYFYLWDPLLKQLRELRTAEGSCGKKSLISYFSSFFWDPSTNS